MIKNIGFVFLGMVIFAGLMVWQMPSMMITERESPMEFDETVNRIVANAKNIGWTVSEPRRIDKSIKKHGGREDILPTALIELCQADYAGKILKDDDARFVSVMMPCTISVYKKSDGKTYIASMNAGLMGKIFGGTIAEIMGNSVSKDQNKILNFLE